MIVLPTMHSLTDKSATNHRSIDRPSLPNWSFSILFWPVPIGIVIEVTGMQDPGGDIVVRVSVIVGR
jgi:hypothetical protein